MVSGTTQVVAMVGHPTAQVKLPDNLNHYFAKQYMDSVMIPMDIAPNAVVGYLNAPRGWQDMTGVLVMVSHRQRAAALVGEFTSRARRLSAINVIRKLVGGRLWGDTLDGVGFQLAVEAQGFQPTGKQALFPNRGGAGSAIVWGLCEAGIRQLVLHDQNPAIRRRPRDLLAEAFLAVQLSTLPDTLRGVDLLVNGSLAGMAGSDELPLLQTLLDTFDSTTHVADIVTTPMMMPLLTFAAARGCRVQAGSEMAPTQMMLVDQFIGTIPPAQGAVT